AMRGYRGSRASGSIWRAGPSIHMLTSMDRGECSQYTGAQHRVAHPSHRQKFYHRSCLSEGVMKTFGLARGLITIALLTFGRAGMAQECPVSNIGNQCDVSGFSGTCIGARCSDTADGSTVVRACAACV